MIEIIVAKVPLEDKLPGLSVEEDDLRCKIFSLPWPILLVFYRNGGTSAPGCALSYLVMRVIENHGEIPLRQAVARQGGS